jgi:hypothetical protein
MMLDLDVSHIIGKLKFSAPVVDWYIFHFEQTPFSDFPLNQ